EILIETSTTMEPGSWQFLSAGKEHVGVDQTGVPGGFRRRVFDLPTGSDRLFARTVVRLPGPVA
ncbi:MAG: hypothetical protein KDN05_15555, partial [Verrucomicrobiae bacterium]|nr:hypothetical protein [Verrucomicrobiae bacterium]